MSNTLQTDAEVSEALSELMDGEFLRGEPTRGRDVRDVCDAWRTRESARADWHAYQLIGDVLRSDDLSSTAAHDAKFLNSLRGRLALEPVVFAPPQREEPAVGTAAEVSPALRRFASSSRWSWAAPSAIAASFVVVAGVLLMPNRGTDSAETNMAQSNGPTSVSVGSPSGAEPVVTTSVADASPAAIEPQALVVSGALVRDARLDQYLAAHKQFATTTVLGVPSGFLRNAVADVPAR